MKVLYIAKHNQFDNEDELAIAHALRVNGHDPITVQEFDTERSVNTEADFCLVHNYSNFDVLKSVSYKMPVVCWFFDKIEFTDIQLQGRSVHRTQWLNRMLGVCSHVFLTDGDAVNSRPQYPNLHWLTQGMDERKIGRGNPDSKGEHYDILFTGTPRHGTKREEHIAQLQQRWGSRFHVIGAGLPKTRVHGRELADLFARTKIVVAPDGPGSDYYWSNRVYLTMGLGGFLLHPYSAGLRRQYPGPVPLMYNNREELNHFIEQMLNPKKENDRQAMIEAGLVWTANQNLYRHRVQDLIRIVEKG